MDVYLKKRWDLVQNLVEVAESYPDLKASQNFSDLTHQLSKIEDEIIKY